MQIKDALGVKQQLLEEKNRTGTVGRTDNSATASGAMAKEAASDKVELSSRSRELAMAAEAASMTMTTIW